MFDRVSRFVARHRWQQFIWSVALLACALGAPFFTGGTGGAPADSSSTLHAQPPATRPKQVFRRPVARAALANEPVEPESKRLLSTAQLQEQIDAALGAEIPPLQSPVLVLPVTGSDGKVRHDGLGIAAQVLEAISDGRQDRAFPAPGRTLEVLVNSECWRPGSEISVRLANACLKSIDASLAVACSLSSTAAGHKLEIRFWREAGQTDGEVVSRNIRPGRLNTVPGLIALEILSRTGVLLSNAEMNNIREPQVSGDEGATVLGEFLTGVASPGAKLARLRAFLDHNPRCHRGWKLLLNHGGALPLTPSGPDAAPAIRFNPVGLQLTAIPNLLDAGRPQEAWKQLMAVPPAWRADWGYLSLLVQCAARLDETLLVERLLTRWESLQPGYGGKCMRGELLLEIAESDPQFPSATEQPNERPSYRDLLRAKKELDEAVSLHHDGWEAHQHLMTIATMSSLPRTEMESHFAQAAAVVPGSQTTYRRKLEYLTAHRTQVEDVADLFTFAEECVATGLWQQGIPQMTVDAVQAATCDRQSGSHRYTMFERPDLWHAVEVWHKSAQQHAWAADRRLALNARALWGALGSHFADVFDTYRVLERDYAENTYDEFVFGTTYHFAYLDDLVCTDTKDALELINVQIRLALSEGDIDRAERHLTDMGSSDRDRMADGYRAAIRLGKRLESERRVDVGPAELRGARRTDSRDHYRTSRLRLG